MPGQLEFQERDGITLLGLGPGDAGMITRDAWEWLLSIDTLYLRTQQHPTVQDLPDHLTLESFDRLYEEQESFEGVYEEIVEIILDLGQKPGGVTYAVPGHPFVAEATCPEIVRRAEEEDIPVQVIDGLSFIEPSVTALGLDPFPELVLADALTISLTETPGINPAAPVLIAQIYSRAVASDVKLTLMTVYPDDHPVRLIHGAGTAEQRVEDMPLFGIDRSAYLSLLSSLYVTPLSEYASFESFQEIIARLRAPDGCPWDRAQTHLSLRPFLLEETYETLDALDREDGADLEEELGDLLLQIVLHAQIAAEEGDFNMQDVLEGIGKKLVRRHPHIFSTVDVEDVSDVIQNWEAIKADERKQANKSSIKGLLDGVPLAMPALLQAEEIIERVQRVAFDQLSALGKTNHIQKILKTIETVNAEVKPELIGDLLLSVVSLAHQAGVNSESALRETLTRFRRHFNIMEVRTLEAGQMLVHLSADEKARLWSEIGGDVEGRAESQ